MQFKIAFLLVFVILTRLLSAQDSSISSQTSNYHIVDSILISGNKVTKEKVFFNELTFNSGDTIFNDKLTDILAQVKQNLLNTSLFNFVWVTSSTQPNGRMNISITVQERWYWWVMPILEHADRNFSAYVNDGQWSRIRYGAFVQNNNFLGRKKLLRFRVKLGYQNVFNFLFQSPQYKYKIGWGFGIDFLAQDQIQCKTNYDKPISSELYYVSAFKKSDAKFIVNYRHHLYYRHQISIIYNNLTVSDSIMLLNPNFLFDGKTNIHYFEVTYSYNKDTRDSKIYPLSGRFYGVDITGYGLGLTENKMNYIFGGVHFKQFFPLRTRFNFGSEWDGYIANQTKIPYFLNFGLGYQDFIHGYEYNVIEGSSYFTSQNRLMFNLLPTKTFNIKFIPLGQFSKVHYAFYLKTLFDFAYVSNKYPNSTNQMTNTLLYAGGLELDFVTYYDKVFGVSYSLNRQGDHGVYFHINLKL